MANVVYANPFGNYVEGQRAGLEDTVRAGTAARSFRDSDLNAEFMKWYAPLRRQEATTAASEHTLGYNQNLESDAARKTALGAPGNQYFSDVLNRIYPGYSFGDVTAGSQLDLRRAAGEATGNPISPYDPAFSLVGPHYAQKVENISPEQFAQTMALRYGPNWQQQQSGAQQTPEFSPFEQATSHIFGTPNSANRADGPAAGSGGVQAPPGVNSPINLRNPNQAQQQSHNPTSIWADERQALGGAGASNIGNGSPYGVGNPRVNSATGGF